jgi:hypothetical protein
MLSMEKSEGNRPLGRPKSRWYYNIRKNLRVMGWEGVDWMHLAQDKDQWWVLLNTVINLQVPQKARNLTS